MNKNELQRQLNKKRASMLRKMLNDKLYFYQRESFDRPSSNIHKRSPSNKSFKELLTKLLTKLHQCINSDAGSVSGTHYARPLILSGRQYEVIDNAIAKYKIWLTKDSEDPMFISNRNLHIRKLDTIKKALFPSHPRTGTYNELHSEHYNRGNFINTIIRDMKSQLVKRKMLLTDKQKRLCNKLYKEVKGLNEKV